MTESLVERISKPRKNPSIIKWIAEVIAKKFTLDAEKCEQLVNYIVSTLIETATGQEMEIITQLPKYWYACLWDIYALSDDIELFPILVEGEISSGKSVTIPLTLEPLNKACLCPKYIAYSDIAPAVKTTIIVNKDVTRIDVPWKNKYVTLSSPTSPEIPQSLEDGANWVVFPKITLNITITNTHPSDSGYYMIYTTGMLVTIDYGIYLIEHVFVPCVRKIRDLMMPPR